VGGVYSYPHPRGHSGICSVILLTWLHIERNKTTPNTSSLLPFCRYTEAPPVTNTSHPNPTSQNPIPNMGKSKMDDAAAERIRRARGDKVCTYFPVSSNTRPPLTIVMDFLTHTVLSL
jgi:hypothetical protein